MWNIFNMELVLVYSLAILATAAGCRFGSGPDCEYQCHCMHNEACDSITGDCANGCDDGSPDGYMWSGDWSGPGCQVGNVAYGLEATGSMYNGFGRPGSLALDGDRNPVDQRECAYSRARIWQDLYWSVDVGISHVIYNLTVYGTDVNFRTGHNYWRSRVVEVGDEVSGFSPCGTLGNNNTALQIDVVCPEPLLGTHVRIRASQYDASVHPPRLYLCEVFVTGYRFTDCVNGAFGPGCLTACHCRDQCDVISGQCSSQCDVGWAGSNCQERLPVLRISTTVMKANQTYLEVEVVVEEPSPFDGVWSWFYTVQIRREGDAEWLELSVINGSISGVVTIKISNNFTLNATYDLRVVPWFTYEEATYQGLGENYTKFTVKAPPVEGKGSAQTLIIVVVVVLIVALLVIIAVVLRRRILMKANGAHEGSQSRNTELNLHSTGNKIVPQLNTTSVVDDHPYEEIPVSALESTPRSIHEDSMDPTYEYEILIPPDVTLETSTTLPEAELEAQPTQYEELVLETPRAVRDRPPGNDSDESRMRNIYENEDHKGRPIKVQDLANYIHATKNVPNAFKDQYMQIPSGKSAEWFTAATAENKGKNRFNNIMAYDHSRVELDVSGDDPGQGYINASFIPGYKDIEKAYIATQGPRVHTVVDMWQMIWQYKINRLVMMTDIMEQGKATCEYYWPNSGDSGEEDFGGFKVKLVKTDNYADYIIRTMSVRYKGEIRKVMHFQFVGWSDHGVPLVATSLLEFRRKVRTFDNGASGPLVVHCSSGVDRSSAYIALDYLLDQARAEGEVDVFKYTTLMRTYRIDMIPNVTQYIFLYEALLQGLFYADIAIHCGKLVDVFHVLQHRPGTQLSPLEKQFEELERIKPSTAGDNLDELHQVPMSRPFMFPRPDEGGHTINAVFVDSYRHQKALIVTQVPLPKIIRNFWQMIYDHRSSSIVLLHEFDHADPEHEMCPPYWPTEVGDVMKLGALDVELEAETIVGDDVISRQFRITNARNTKEEPLVVCQLHSTGWPADVDTPKDPGSLFTLLEILGEWQQASRDKTVTVQCKTGFHHSGVFCTASIVLEKLTVDQEVDAFLAVSQTRLGCPQFIHSLEQYVFLHEIALKYMEKNNDMYVNLRHTPQYK